MPSSERIDLSTPGWSSPTLPVVVHRGAVAAGDPDAVEATLAANGWPPDWRDGIYPFHHFHSTAHEALACVEGDAVVTLGGPDGVDVVLRAGDVLVLPAGTGHRRVRASEDFLVIGAYPDGRGWDVRREPAGEKEAASIAAVPLPRKDPIFGDGCVVDLWKERARSTSTRQPPRRSTTCRSSRATVSR